MPLPLFTVDAFTTKPFAGNPAGVCLLPSGEWPDALWMQHVAAEMNLSETAFVRPNVDGSFGLRWMTPKVEVDLCGHATLASAHVLYETGRATDTIRFESRSGTLKAAKIDAGIELDFPLSEITKTDPPAGLLDALAVSAKVVAKTRFDYLLAVESAGVVRAAKPDFVRLKNAEARGVILTARSDDPQFDFISRFFAPSCGIDEDPVTGSAHCALAHFWGTRLNKSEMVGYQASARGGVVNVRIFHNRCFLSGRAVTVAAGELRV
ncbi:MAG TPA: PhzF family phenazine biosynthesis protein [Fimbriiglobus sp.]|jgi:PhzF family phenazine biosynthesis protein